MKQTAVIGVGLAVLGGVVLAGQGAAPADGAAAALLAEVKALRADVQAVANTGIRVQMLVGRLQLQEQRVLARSRQLDEVQREVMQFAQNRAAMESQIKLVMESDDAPQAERDEIVANLREQLEQQQKREQQLRAQESSLDVVLAEEQSRWNDLNSRLDELERMLPPPSRR